MRGGIPDRVPACERAGGAADPRRRPAEHARRAAGRASARASPRRGRARPRRCRCASSRWAVESPPTNRPTSISATAPPIVSSAAGGPKRAKRDGGSTAPSRTAAIGGTLRRAERRPQRREQRDRPRRRASETTIVRVANTRPGLRQVDPEGDEQGVEPLRQAEPEEQADDRGERADHERLDAAPTCSTWRRVAPSVRSVASSRVRWAIVIESVFAITKLPTNSATPPNASRKSWMMLRKPLVSLVACCACACAGSHLRGGRQQRADLACTSCAGRGAGLRGDVDLVELALLVEEPLRGREVEDRHRRAAERRDAADLDDAGDAESLLRAACDDADRLADREVLLAGGVGVDRDLVRRRPASAPAVELERVEPLVAGGSTLKASAGAPPPEITLPSRPTSWAQSRDTALRRGDARQAPHPRRAATAGTTAAAAPLLRAPDRALAGDHGVGVLVDLGEDRAERGLDRVREHVGAAHHRDAEHDRDRGQRGPQLAPEQPLERDADHDWSVAHDRRARPRRWPPAAP